MEPSTIREILISGSKVLYCIGLVTSPLWFINLYTITNLAVGAKSAFQTKLLYLYHLSLIAEPLLLVYTVYKQFHGDRSNTTAILPLLPIVSIYYIYRTSEKRGDR